MNWSDIIKPILDRGYTLAEIAAKCGFASAGAVHDLLSGRQATCEYERGAKLLKMWRTSARRAR